MADIGTIVDQVTVMPTAWGQDVNDQVYVNAGVTYLTSVAGTNTITGTSAPAQTAYKARQVFWFIPANTNTGATTLNVSSLGAKNVFFANAACTGGEIRANIPCGVIYDGTQFQLVGPFVGGAVPGIASFTNSVNTVGTTLSVLNNTATTILAIGTNTGAWKIFAGVADVNCISADVIADGTNVAIGNKLNGGAASIDLTVSGTNVRVTQTIGSTQTVFYSYLRIK